MNGSFSNTRYVSLSKVDDVQYDGNSLVNNNKIVDLIILNTLMANIDDLTNYYKKTETYNKTEIDSKISAVFKYKGAVATYSNLPTTNRQVGDVWDVQDSGKNYAWNGTNWDDLGGSIDLTNYYNKTEITNLLSTLQTTLSGQIDAVDARVTTLDNKVGGIDDVLDLINGEVI